MKEIRNNLKTLLTSINIESILLITGLFLPLVLLTICWITSIIITIYKIIKYKQYQFNTINILLIVFILLSFIVHIYNHNWFGLINLILYVLLSITIINVSKDIINKKQLNNTLLLLMLLSFLSFILAIIPFNIDQSLYNYVTNYLGLQQQLSLLPASRLSSTFTYPNYYGYITSLIIIISFYSYSINNHKYISIISIITNLIALYLTGSRTSLISLIFIIFILLISKYPIQILLISFVFIVIIFINPNILNTLIPRFNHLLYSFNDRQSLWIGGFYNFLDSKYFGHGLYSYMTNYYKYSNNYNVHCHNLLIELLASFGLAGLLILLVVIYYIYKPVYSIKCNEKYYLLLIILLVLTNGLLDVVILFPMTYCLTLLLISLYYYYIKGKSYGS